MISIIIPTYNEAENILQLIPRIRKAVNNCEIIVVDDGSTDGTEKAAKILRAKVLQRGSKMGLVSAVMDGFKISRGKIIGVMDADLSHPPEIIPELLRQAKTGKIAVASRYAGGSEKNWPLFRKLVSVGATGIARITLGIKVRDCMSGFFFAPRKVFEKTRLRATGYKILLNILVDNNDTKVVEIPYEFVERIRGESKLGINEIFNYLKTVAALSSS